MVKILVFENDYNLMLLIPPSIPIICPVIQDEFSDNRNSTIFPISFAFPILCNGCLFPEASLFSCVERSCEERFVSVKDGAMELTLIF